jgi:hypothetical protein
MRSITRLLAALELLLIFPAALFMTALVVRELRPLPYEPAHTAQWIVMWYAGRMWTLWVLLLALPFAVLVTGCVTLLRGLAPSPPVRVNSMTENRAVESPNTARQSLAMIRTHPATLTIAATTLAAAVILVIVALHMLAN